MRYIIDRIEEDTAICEDAHGKFHRIAVNQLPKAIKEGSVLTFQNGVYALDIEEEDVRRERISAKLAAILKKTK